MMETGVNMAITQELINVLVCPETKQSLKRADLSIVDSFNEQIQSGGLCNKGKKSVVQEVSDLLIREDGQVLYQVRDDIPILLIEEGIATCDLENK